MHISSRSCQGPAQDAGPSRLPPARLASRAACTAAAATLATSHQLAVLTPSLPLSTTCPCCLLPRRKAVVILAPEAKATMDPVVADAVRGSALKVHVRSGSTYKLANLSQVSAAMVRASWLAVPGGRAGQAAPLPGMRWFLRQQGAAALLAAVCSAA